jgi:tellurium resistance protein TerD
MAITLNKGGNISLSKTDPSLTKLIIGLGWDTRATDGQDFDLDASAFLTNAAGKTRGDGDFIFYNNLSTPDGVTHTGDNRTGAGDGDDEQIKIDLTKLPADVNSVFITVTIHDAEARRQNFGQVRNAFARVVNETTNAEVARYDLGEDFSTETAVIFCEVYRNAAEWKFRAVGQGFAGGLNALVRHYGLNAG